MAWVTQKFETGRLEFSLEADKVRISGDGYSLDLRPQNRESAHDLALCFRRIARRLEEIGKGLA